jgi:hypothetical protein
MARRLAGDDRGVLEPMILRAPRHGVPPLDPPAQAARLALDALGVDSALLSLTRGKDRVLLWSELASWIR